MQTKEKNETWWYSFNTFPLSGGLVSIFHVLFMIYYNKPANLENTIRALTFSIGFWGVFLLALLFNPDKTIHYKKTLLGVHLILGITILFWYLS